MYSASWNHSSSVEIHSMHLSSVPDSHNECNVENKLRSKDMSKYGKLSSYALFVWFLLFECQ